MFSETHHQSRNVPRKQVRISDVLSMKPSKVQRLMKNKPTAQVIRGTSKRGLWVLYQTNPRGAETYFRKMHQSGMCACTSDAERARPFLTARSAYEFAALFAVLSAWRVGARLYAGVRFIP